MEKAVYDVQNNKLTEKVVYTAQMLFMDINGHKVFGCQSHMEAERCIIVKSMVSNQSNWPGTAKKNALMRYKIDLPLPTNSA